MTRGLDSYCSECRMFGFHLRGCPNEPPPREVHLCGLCRAGIMEGEEYYQIGDLIYCEDCMAAFREIAGEEAD